jgi:hypothetical protein
MVKRRPDVQAEIDVLLAFRRGLRNPYDALTGWDAASPSAPSRRLCFSRKPGAPARPSPRPSHPGADAAASWRASAGQGRCSRAAPGRTLAGPGRASPGRAWALSLAQPLAPQLWRKLSQPRAPAGCAGLRRP